MELTSVVGITEICARLKLTARAVRFYEDEGLVLVGRDRNNNRIFNRAAQRDLELIAMLRRADVALKDIRRVLNAAGEGGARQRAMALGFLAAKQRHFQQRAAETAALADALARGGGSMPAGRAGSTLSFEARERVGRPLAQRGIGA